MTPTSPSRPTVAFTRPSSGPVPSFVTRRTPAPFSAPALRSHGGWLPPTKHSTHAPPLPPEHLDAYLAGPLLAGPGLQRTPPCPSCGAMAATARASRWRRRQMPGPQPSNPLRTCWHRRARRRWTRQVRGRCGPRPLAAWDCNPTTVARPSSWCATRLYLAAWVTRCGLPLRRDVVFHPDTVEEFAALLATALRRPRTGTIASSLRTMSRTLFPPLSAKVAHPVGPRRCGPIPPTGLAEVDSLFTFASRAFSAKAPRHFGLPCAWAWAPVRTVARWACRLEDGRLQPRGQDDSGPPHCVGPLPHPHDRDARCLRRAILVPWCEAAADGDIWLLRAGGMRSETGRRRHL